MAEVLNVDRTRVEDPLPRQLRLRVSPFRSDSVLADQVFEAAAAATCFLRPLLITAAHNT